MLPCRTFSVLFLSKECRWREMEEHRQAERLQRQLQQEQAYLLSLQHDHRRPPPQHTQPPQPPLQQERSKPGYHAPEPKPHYDPADRAREVSESSCAWPGLHVGVISPASGGLALAPLSRHWECLAGKSQKSVCPVICEM